MFYLHTLEFYEARQNIWIENYLRYMAMAHNCLEEGNVSSSQDIWIKN
jgi:hypothetical protein